MRIVHGSRTLNVLTAADLNSYDVETLTALVKDEPSSRSMIPSAHRLLCVSRGHIVDAYFGRVPGYTAETYRSEVRSQGDHLPFFDNPFGVYLTVAYRAVDGVLRPGTGILRVSNVVDVQEAIDLFDVHRLDELIDKDVTTYLETYTIRDQKPQVRLLGIAPISPV
jgi:hypothetical protein